MKKLLLGISLSAIALLVGFSMLPLINSVQADEEELFKIGGNGYQCLGDEDNRWKVETGNSATLPDGYSIESVVVKAGSNCIPVYPTNTATDCYSVELVGQTVTVTKDGDGRDCQDISHLEGTYLVNEDPDPICEDEEALNYGEEEECEYPDPVCEDEEALNYGEEEDCEYPETTPTPTPTPTPEPTPTPSSTPDKEHSSLYVQQLSCDENDFRAQLDLFSGDHPQQDVLVTFTYNGLSQNTYTNKDGRATVNLSFAGEGTVKATPNNGYSAQEAKVTKETNCSAVGGPVVSGQVLGANTYAETGVLEDIMMSVLGLSGATMTAVGAKLHAKKKN